MPKKATKINFKVEEERDDTTRMSRDDGSQYSLTGILPPLGATARNRRRGSYSRFVISPFNPQYRAWESFLVILVFYTAWVSPFEFGFLERPGWTLNLIDNVVNAFFAADIAVTFFVAYLDKTTYLLVEDPKLIAKRYAKTWLVLDIVSTIPSEAARALMPPSVRTYGYLTMLRLWRLRRVSAMFARLEKDRRYSYIWVRFAKLTSVTLFTVHFAGCMFYFIAARNRDPARTWIGQYMENFHEESLWDRYVTSMYWSLVTLTSIGYGDLHPVNTSEMIFDFFYMLGVLFLQAYLVGNMTNIVVHATARTREFRDKIQAATGFAKRNQLPVQLQEQMLAHLSLKYRTNAEGLEQQETLNALPKAIRTSIAQFLFYTLVDNVYLFHGVSNDLLIQLVSEMSAEYIPPGEEVILQNEPPTDLYILVTGSAELIRKGNGVEQIVSVAKTGDVVGEIGVLCYRPQPFAVRTKRLSQLLRLSRTAFLNIVQANVGDGTIILNNLLKHLKELKDPVMEEILADTESMLARGRMDLPLSPCFAAARGDDALMLQLLTRGSDPNETGLNGQTAMHIAASNGNLSCVDLLLEYGANPNVKDSAGSTPLEEAIVGNHEAVIKLLLENGAEIAPEDVGCFACALAEHNNLELLKEVADRGHDVTLPKSDGSTALHSAVCEGNVEIVRFLLKQGADVDKADARGWTARDLADQQDHNEIKELFLNNSGTQTHRLAQPSAPARAPAQIQTKVSKFKSESALQPYYREGNSVGKTSTRRRARNFGNSLFGVMSAAKIVERERTGDRSSVSGVQGANQYPARVIVLCPEKGEVGGHLVRLPESLPELLDIGTKKFGISAPKVLTKEGAGIDDIALVRDGDHLVFVSDGAN